MVSPPISISLLLVSVNVLFRSVKSRCADFVSTTNSRIRLIAISESPDFWSCLLNSTMLSVANLVSLIIISNEPSSLKSTLNFKSKPWSLAVRVNKSISCCALIMNFFIKFCISVTLLWKFLEISFTNCSDKLLSLSIRSISKSKSCSNKSRLISRSCLANDILNVEYSACFSINVLNAFC